MSTAREPLLRASAIDLAGRIRRREVSSRAVVDAHIDAVERLNPVLNAVVADRFVAARAEADEADRRLAAHEPALGPLHGVPCTIKECFALVGMPNTSGLVSRRSVQVDHDATTVARLRAAGAIPIGVTNTSELCMWMESNNRVYGRTNNPYDPSRIVGGSSGGEGAIVGSGASPFGLGSDIGGSIRMPAFFNGVFGHKPTGGLVPSTGQYPSPGPGALASLATGPLCRRAEDLMPLLRVLAGPDGFDAVCKEATLLDPADVDLSTLRVVDIADNGFVGVTRDLREAQQRVATHLERLGARVERPRIPALKQSLEIWSEMMSSAGGTSFADLLGDGRQVRPARELLRWAARRSPHTLPAIVLAMVEKWAERLPGAERAARVGRELRAEIVERIGPHGVLLFPSYASPAPRHYVPLMPPIRWAYTAIWNALQIPVTQVPLGLNAQGLPLGVQVGAVHDNDHVTIAVALELERAFGGWVVPPMSVVA